jgi:hypothetical protein
MGSLSSGSKRNQVCEAQKQQKPAVSMQSHRAHPHPSSGSIDNGLLPRKHKSQGQTELEQHLFPQIQLLPLEDMYFDSDEAISRPSIVPMIESWDEYPILTNQ